MTALDTTTNGKSNPEKKPVTDHAADKKVADHSVADPKKLHDDSHTAPLAAKAAAKPAESKPAESHSVLGWFADKEKAAEAAIKGAVDSVKADVKAIASTVKADVNAVTSTVKAEVKADVKALSTAASTTVAAGEKALKQFGNLTLTDDKTDASAKSAKADAKPVPARDGKDGTDSKTAIPMKQASAETPSAAQPTDAGQATSPVSFAPFDAAQVAYNAVAKMATTVVTEVETVAKAGLDMIMSHETEESLLSAAKTYGSVALDASGAMVLPTLVGYAGSAYQGYKEMFGPEKFSANAEKVKSLDDVTYESLNNSKVDKLEKQEETYFKYADSLARQNDGYMIAGDEKPGGTAEIINQKGLVTADGKTITGVDYKVEVGAHGEHAHVGAFDISKGDGTTVDTKDFHTTVIGTVTTSESKEKGLRIIYDSKTHTTEIMDLNSGINVFKDANGKKRVQLKDGRMLDLGKNSVNDLIDSTSQAGKMRLAVNP